MCIELGLVDLREEQNKPTTFKALPTLIKAWRAQASQNAARQRLDH